MVKRTTSRPPPSKPSVPSGTLPLTEPIKLTKWTASQPVTKRLWLDATGKLNKEPAGQLYEGQIIQLAVKPKQFVAVLTNIGSNDCLSYGVPINDAATRVMTRSKYAGLADTGNVMARTADAMSWPSGPGIMMIDYDPNGTALPPKDLQGSSTPTSPTLTSVTKVKVKGKNYARLSWSGATGASVDYFRNSTKYTTANDGSHDDGPLTTGTYAYKVCLTGTATCSATISITY
jgi:hypothetical protein